MQNLILTVGLQASGKSTWAKNEVKGSKGTIKRVNKDEIRELLDGGEYSSDNEKFVLKTRDTIVMQALRAGKHVIVDDTNFEEKHFNDMVRIATGIQKDIHVFEKFFPIDWNEAIARDAARLNPVGKTTIMKYYNKYVKYGVRTLNNTFVTKASLPQTFYHGTPYALICDLDGTLANIEHRNPYDTGQCIKDSVNSYVADAVIGLYKMGYRVLFVSGREERFRKETEEWLNREIILNKADVLTDPSAVPNTLYYKLFMRATGDFRKDYVIKKQIFDSHIRNHYNVKIVFDDRPSVIRMWRYEVGLPVFQVNDIEF